MASSKWYCHYLGQHLLKVHYKIHFLGFISLRDMLDLRSSRDLGFWDDDEDIEGKGKTVIANHYSNYYLSKISTLNNKTNMVFQCLFENCLQTWPINRFCIKGHKKILSIEDFYLEEIGKLNGGLIRTSAFYHKLTICPKGWNCDLYHWWDLLLGLNSNQ